MKNVDGHLQPCKLVSDIMMASWLARLVVPHAQADPDSVPLSEVAEHQGVSLDQLIQLQIHNEKFHQGIIIVERLLGGSTDLVAAHSRYGKQNSASEKGQSRWTCC